MADFSDVFEQDPSEISTILVVEDDPDISQLLESSLETFGPYKVLSANNAFQAVHILSSVQPDLFLFDYRLPSVDGLELYSLLHAQSSFANIPVLFLSAYAPREFFEKQHLPSMGKPFELEHLLQKVDALLAG